MPLEEVVAKYGRSEDETGHDDDEDENDDDEDGNDASAEKGESSAPKKLLVNPVVAELSKKGAKPISPFLRAKTVSRVAKGAEPETKDGNVDNSEAVPEADEPAAANEDASKENSEDVKVEAVAPKIEPEPTETKEKPTNGHGHVNDSDDAKTPTVNGDSANSNPTAVSTKKGKGVGKGKSKTSAAITKTDAALEDNHDDDGEADVKVVQKKKPAKSAEELYHHVLIADSDADDEDLDDEDDENFGEAGDEDEDSEDYEDVVRV